MRKDALIQQDNNDRAREAVYVQNSGTSPLQRTWEEFYLSQSAERLARQEKEWKGHLP